MMTAPYLDETGPVWRALDPIPDVGQWAVTGQTTAEATLEQMVRAVNKAIRMRQVVELACAVVSQLQERDYRGSLCLIGQYVRRHFRFVRDPNKLEMLRRPEYMLQRIQSRGVVFGDCDDMAQLIATLGKAIGFPAEFHAISFMPGGKPYTHVYAVLRLPDGSPVEFDLTRPAKFRRCPPPITGRLVRRV
jgi:transglutaminase-like putative cysteine protease